MDVATAFCALLAITRALCAVEVVDDVSSASSVSGWRPLQGDAGFIDS